MEILGTINNRKVLYFNVRRQTEWFQQLPPRYWIAFTIADKPDEPLLNEVSGKCLDKGASYICSTGELAADTEDCFDQEIVWREIQKEMETSRPPDYDATPMTVSFSNFSEGFWFAAVSAYPTINDNYLPVQTLVCIDCTARGVKEHLLELVSKINSGWVPSDDEMEPPVYDPDRPES